MFESNSTTISIQLLMTEKNIAEKFNNYLYTNNVRYGHQFGFRKGSTTEYICSGIDNCYKGVERVLFDYLKPFDLVDHFILLTKLHFIEVGDESLKLFNDSLQNRSQYVQSQYSSGKVLQLSAL